MPIFISEVKKKKAQKRKTSTVTYAFYLNISFYAKFSSKYKLFVSVVTLCDILYSRYKRFFGLNIVLQKRFKLEK